MAGGWSIDGAVEEQIEASLDDALSLARKNLPTGESAEYCNECGEPIPEPRRKALPGVRYCIVCQQALEKERQVTSTYNRRASKDSQLK